VLHDVTENELALAAGVAGVDEAGDVLALEQLLQEPQALLAALYGFQVEMRWDDRQIGKGPFAPLDFTPSGGTSSSR